MFRLPSAALPPQKEISRHTKAACQFSGKLLLFASPIKP
ncbi:hypothetical protein BRO54_1855 [Geobacillus proteiniphilus]|uniref:Uncharacterized protein n=1 Tax=Geobacillus proteiniphilus TaxID=860353 RepID=A0A1Q5T023_9BACL|nr:hypothetical protein BRO54_1855 [Geobacillus proteiniphilus]